MSMNEKYPLALPEGTILAGQYTIEKVLGQGGFGITYKAKDYKTNQSVAVKEFFPDTLAYREMTTVISYQGERTDSFVYGKESFLQEAQTLAQFIGNENIVRVYTYFEENGTAYFVMDYIEGKSFDVYLKEKGGRITVEEAKNILIPVMDALGAVHSKGIVHRDVTPDNIYITNEGKIMLLDFGAARYSLGDKSRSLDVILKHGFAPKEQYTRRGKQGPFTDIYSLGATFYFAITGKRPPDSVDRLDEDDLVPPHNLGVSVTEYQETAILKALNVQPADRFQTMAEFKNVLLNEAAAVPQTPYYVPAIPPQPSVSQPTAYANPNGQTADSSVDELKNALIHTGAATKKAIASAAGSMKKKVSDAQHQVSEAYHKKAEEKQNSVPTTQQNIASSIGNTVIPTQAPGEYNNITANGDRDTIGNSVSAAVLERSTSEQAVPSPTYVEAPRKKKNKTKLIGASAAVICVVLVTFFVGRGFSGKTDPSNSYTSDDTTTSESTSGDYGEDAELSSADPYSESASSAGEDNTPQISSVPPVYTQAELEIVGNTAGNIKNCATVAMENNQMFWATENQHALHTNTTSSGYLFTEQSGVFSSLSYHNGILYFLYDGNAYMQDISAGTESTTISELEKYSDIECLYVASGCYFVYADGKLYRVSRKTGAEEEYIEIDDRKKITFSGGNLFYIGESSDGYSTIYRTPADNFSHPDSDCINTASTSDSFYDIVASGDNLFALCDSDSGMNLCQFNTSFTNSNQAPYWNVLDFIPNYDYPYELNAIGNKLDFLIYSSSSEIMAIYCCEISGEGQLLYKNIFEGLGYCVNMFDRGDRTTTYYMSYNDEEKMYISYYHDN